MTSCSDFEVLLSDYLDGTLGDAVREDMDRHMTACPACAEMFEDAKSAIEFIGRVNPVVPPADLITRIAYQAPRGPAYDSLQRRGFLGRVIGKWLTPVLQPRFAMGMAMTILSFAMLERCTGVQVQHIKPSDLSPVHVWDGFQDRVLRTRDRAVKSYENLLVVYDIESRLRALREDNPPTDHPQQTGKAQGKASNTQDSNANPKQGDQSK